MLVAVLLTAQVAATAATCGIPGDPQERSWRLDRHDTSWRVVFQSRALDQPQVVLQLPNTSPSIATGEIRVSYKSANGGRSIEWRITDGPSTLDLYVNHGLEVNVEADLDPAVDLMNTDGHLAVVCVRGSGPFVPAQSPRGWGANGRQDNDFSEPARAASTTPVQLTTPTEEWSRPREWTVAAGLARSVNLFESTSGRGYAVQTVAWGRELTRAIGPGWLQGRFAWAIEAMPIFAQFTPSALYGLGVSPVVWRWNFTPRPRWSAFAELSMGGLWTTDPIPEDAGTANFTAHWGGGVRLHSRGPNGLLLGYRFQHLSNGNQLGSNPGVNSHVILLGWSHRS